MSHLTKMTLIGMYNYDPDLFANLHLPSTIDKSLFIDSLLLSNGERPVLYGDPGFMKAAISIWGRKWFEAFENIQEALTGEYNKLHNFDRNEEYEDTEDSTDNENNTAHRYSYSKAEGDSENENKVSAYNASTYQPDSDSTGHTEDEVSAETNDTDTKAAAGHRRLTHTAHLYGNIGLTTSQQMILEEINLRTVQNIYDIMSSVFAKEFLLYLY